MIAIDGQEHVLWPDASLCGGPIRRYLDDHQSSGHHGVINGDSQPACPRSRRIERGDCIGRRLDYRWGDRWPRLKDG
jgi:hypothetical protein